ncbi:MAG: hypothetical protein V9E94_00245 [Microthrixaceae bacterium]
MCSDHLGGHFWFAQTPEDRHRLRSTERQIPSRDLSILRAVQLLTGAGIEPVEHSSEFLRTNEPVEPELVR